eukprot:Skav201081  [mRNA]  locus=scaffold2138:77920:80722:- [translate_table: standard]
MGCSKSITNHPTSAEKRTEPQALTGAEDERPRAACPLSGKAAIGSAPAKRIENPPQPAVEAIMGDAAWCLGGRSAGPPASGSQR